LTALPPRLGVLLAIAFWGVSFVATRALVEQVSPVALIFARTALGSLLLVAILAARRRPWVPARSFWPSLLLMGSVGVVMHQLLQAYALQLTTAVNTGWLIGLTPIWSAILAAVHLRERFSPRKVLGLTVGFLGAVLVVTRGEFGGDVMGLPATRGDLMILASTVNWAVYSVMGRPTLQALGALVATACGMIAGCALLAGPFVYRQGWEDFARLDGVGWAAVLFLGLCCSGLGYLWWYGALEHIETSRVAAFLYLEPLVTLLAAVALLGETVGATTIAGGLMLIGGVALVER
jgi:drug/metabolite transporter (DMT)-like permease